MGKIHQLSSTIVSKIAAGEVIEKPVFAVKELIDNALDAKASSITIHIEKSGLKRIQVIDDGVGMSKEDLELAYLPHTTSKITIEQDLYSIKTFGFRGEALSSIAASSKLIITTKQKGQSAAYTLEVEEGKLVKLSPIGADFGTTVTVLNLFSFLPARKKFLKSESIEFKLILDMVLNFAIANPQVKFVLTHNKKQLFNLPSTTDFSQRLKLVLGEENLDQMIPFKIDDSFLKIKIFLSKPQYKSSSTSKQFIFINHRPITDKLISLSIKEAYGHLIASSSYPNFILFLELPFEAVDVNVHPRKEKVSFYNSQTIYDFIFKAITQALEENNLNFNNLNWKDSILQRKLTKTEIAKRLKKETNLWQPRSIIKPTDITQFHNLYLITQTENGIVLIDQHAAHERILYNLFSSEYQQKSKDIQTFKLKTSFSFELPLSESQLLISTLQIFTNLGFNIEQFKDNTFLINQVPNQFKEMDLKILISELLQQIEQGKNIKSLDLQSDKMLQYLACRAAIKAGDKLTKEEAKRLIEKLEQTPNNATCPHGRPTKIEISLNEINHFFRR